MEAHRQDREEYSELHESSAEEELASVNTPLLSPSGDSEEPPNSTEEKTYFPEDSSVLVSPQLPSTPPSFNTCGLHSPKDASIFSPESGIGESPVQQNSKELEERVKKCQKLSFSEPESLTNESTDVLKICHEIDEIRTRLCNAEPRLTKTIETICALDKDLRGLWVELGGLVVELRSNARVVEKDLLDIVGHYLTSNSLKVNKKFKLTKFCRQTIERCFLLRGEFQGLLENFLPQYGNVHNGIELQLLQQEIKWCIEQVDRILKDMHRKVIILQEVDTIGHEFLNRSEDFTPHSEESGIDDSITKNNPGSSSEHSDEQSKKTEQLSFSSSVQSEADVIDIITVSQGIDEARIRILKAEPRVTRTIETICALDEKFQKLWIEMSGVFVELESNCKFAETVLQEIVREYLTSSKVKASKKFRLVSFCRKSIEKCFLLKGEFQRLLDNALPDYDDVHNGIELPYLEDEVHWCAQQFDEILKDLQNKLVALQEVETEPLFPQTILGENLNGDERLGELGHRLARYFDVPPRYMRWYRDACLYLFCLFVIPMLLYIMFYFVKENNQENPIENRRRREIGGDSFYSSSFFPKLRDY